MSSGGTTWHGERAVEVAGEGIRALVLPGRGGKIVSLVDAAGTEWLTQPEDGPLPPVGHGSVFTDAEMCGWDEMAPTIVTPGLPDHGELWSIPWEELPAPPGTVELQVAGRVRDYLLRRGIAPAGPGSLRLSYAARGSSVDLLWAAHPQFAAPAGTTVELPAEIATVVDVDDPDRPREVPWAGGHVDVLATVSSGHGHKIWCRPQDTPSWAALRRPDGATLTLSWDPAEIPYVGVWADNCAWSREPVLALEPATGWYDDVDRAAALGRVLHLDSGSWHRWELTVTLTPPAR